MQILSYFISIYFLFDYIFLTAIILSYIYADINCIDIFFAWKIINNLLFVHLQDVDQHGWYENRIRNK